MDLVRKLRERAFDESFGGEILFVGCRVWCWGFISVGMKGLNQVDEDLTADGEDVRH